MEAHDPSKFSFTKKAKEAPQFVTDDGKYFYSKALNFHGGDYVNIYATNTEIYKSANYLDLLSSSLALIGLEKVVWNAYSLTIQNGHFSAWSIGVWAAVLGVQTQYLSQAYL